MGGGRGFTLLELAVVVVIVGAPAAFTMPRSRASVEHSKAAKADRREVVKRASQEHYQVQQGTCVDDLGALDVRTEDRKHFTAGEITAGPTSAFQDSWALTLTRMGASADYGEYAVGYTAEGSTIAEHDDNQPNADRRDSGPAGEIASG